MGKQALGVYATNYRQRFDTVAHILHYPQRPLISTKTSELIGKELPYGQNAIVAIACYSGMMLVHTVAFFLILTLNLSGCQDTIRRTVLSSTRGR